MDRLAQLRGFIEEKPDDPFPRFALGMELRRAGQLEEAAAVFAELLRRCPGYAPAFLQAGGVLAALGRTGEAAAVYRSGVATVSDPHTRMELEAALAAVEPDA